jgi:uncharacterized membrane-anchored protein YhcB (DUF1043 family)
MFRITQFKRIIQNLNINSKKIALTYTKNYEKNSTKIKTLKTLKILNTPIKSYTNLIKFHNKQNSKLILSNSITPNFIRKYTATKSEIKDLQDVLNDPSTVFHTQHVYQEVNKFIIRKHEGKIHITINEYVPKLNLFSFTFNLITFIFYLYILYLLFPIMLLIILGF